MKVVATAIGDINVDILTSRIKDFPEKDSQILIDNFEIASGGCAANFAKALSLLGLKTRLIAKAGDDELGKFALKSLKSVDLKVSLSKNKKTATTLAIPFTDDTRSFLTYPGANSEFSMKDVTFRNIEGYYLHIASFFLQGLKEHTSEILKYAHDKNMLTTFDTGWDPRGWSSKDTKLVRKVLKDVDVFFPNLREGQRITGAKEKEEIGKRLLALGPKIVALKLGKKGSYIATEKDRVFIPPFKVKSIDTTGAGDVFDAAFVYGHFNKWSLEKTGRFANAAAALSTLDYGSRGYPNQKEVRNLING